MKEIKDIVIGDIDKSSRTLLYVKDEYLLLEKAVMELMAENSLPSPYIINYLSSLTYESSAAHCQVMFVEPKILKQDEVMPVLEFEDGIPFDFDNARAIRKMMVLGSGKYVLLSEWDNHQILGLVDREGVKKIKTFSINFLGHMKWELCFSDESILRFEAGKYKVVSCESEMYLQYKKIEDFFERMGVKESIKQQAKDIIDRAIMQEHGTILIFSGQAKNEVERLGKKRGIKIREKKEAIEIDILLNITAIDGAVFFDLCCQCVGIGVILDGIAENRTELGDIGRGARYNSALTYISNRTGGDSLAIVVSEDKMINVITERSSSV